MFREHFSLYDYCSGQRVFTASLLFFFFCEKLPEVRWPGWLRRRHLLHSKVGNLPVAATQHSGRRSATKSLVPLRRKSEEDVRYFAGMSALKRHVHAGVSMHPGASK